MVSSSRAVRSVIALVAVAAALVVPAAQARPAHKQAPPCADPHPCDYRWDGGTGPFAEGPIEHVRVRSHDGVELEGWIRYPVVPAGVRLPTILFSSPYILQGHPAGDDARARGIEVPIRRYVREGYAVAIFSVRGTGNSGGCFDLWGPDEQRDQKVLVDWLASRPWSNGRVGMTGLSYHGTTPVEAAVQAPDALKAILVAGTITDGYGFFHSPQGAAFTITGPFAHYLTALVSLLPPVIGSLDAIPPSVDVLVDHVPVTPERLCPEVARMQALMYSGTFGDSRDAEFWEPRRLMRRGAQVRAAMFVVHGFEDRRFSGHAWQEDRVWEQFPNAPKKMLLGPWGHQFPTQNSKHPDVTIPDMDDRAVRWFDYWLKGVGPSPFTEPAVEYLDQDGRTRHSAAWPPADADADVRYLAGTSLAAHPRKGDRSFTGIAAPHDPDSLVRQQVRDSIGFPVTNGSSSYDETGWSSPCQDTSPVPGRAVYELPVGEPLALAGNPALHLRLTSTRPDGQVTAHLYDVDPDYTCSGEDPDAALLLSEGVADLRYHDGTSYTARDFPVGIATDVRIDLTNLARAVDAGRKLVLVLSYGDPTERHSRSSGGTITVHAGRASRLVLPVVPAGG